MNSWNYSVFYQEAIDQLKKEFQDNSRIQEFELWFTFEYETSNELEIVVNVPSAFFKDQLIGRGYIDLLENKLLELSGQPLKIGFSIKKLPEKTKASSTSQNNEQKNTVNSVKVETPKRDTVHPQLNKDYTFENFILGDNSAFAYNAALSISKNLGKSYNPFLIYGGVGLGKTHLMTAIGNNAYALGDLKIICVTAETFTNEFIQSIQLNTQVKFKNKYRNADLLLIDDIHFLQNKNETQEELFYTFEALYGAGKQMVFTCDRPVNELKNLSDRLRNRFTRGLCVDLQPPEYETRRAILEKKLEQKNKKMSSDVIDLIAHNVASNVRDLESALTKIEAFADLMGQEITVEIAQNQLRDTFGSPKMGNITIEIIQKVIADYYNISYMDIKSQKRNKNVMIPRQLAMYISRELTEFSTTEIGMEFGGRDHTTVMHSCQKIDDLLKSDTTFETTLQQLKRKIKDYKK